MHVQSYVTKSTRDDRPLAIQSFLKVLLWPGPKTVFEIGACEGEDTVRYARLFPHARIFLFEPLPRNQKSIRRRLAAHGEIRASLHGIALSDLDGESVLYVSSGTSPVDNQAGNKSSSLLKPAKLPKEFSWIKFRKQIKVPTMRLEMFCRDNGIRTIDYIHMDVQGAELKVLEGAGRMISKIGLVWMEVSFQPAYHGQPFESQASQWMRTKGFRKVAQISYGAEADALFLNMRFFSAWGKLILLKILLRMGLIRFSYDNS